MEKVDAATVNDTRELVCTFSQLISYRTHAQDHFQVLSHLHYQLREQLFICFRRVVFTFGFRL